MLSGLSPLNFEAEHKDVFLKHKEGDWRNGCLDPRNSMGGKPVKEEHCGVGAQVWNSHRPITPLHSDSNSDSWNRQDRSCVSPPTQCSDPKKMNKITK